MKTTQTELGEPSLPWEVTLDGQQVLRASNRFTSSNGAQLEINYCGVALDYAGGGGIMSMTSPQAFWRGIQLFADGRFETSTASLLGSPDSLSSGSEASPSIHAASSSDAQGSRSSVSVQAGSVAGGTSQAQADGSAHRGHYRIDGYAIELAHDNGTTKWELFLQSNDDKDAIVVGDTYYWVEKK